MITAIVIGLGERGNVYSDYALAHPLKLKIVGAADIDQIKRAQFQSRFQLRGDQIYESWQDILGDKKIADVAIIATPDTVHFKPAMQAMKLGYDVLLEKPMAPTKEECEALNETSKANNCILQIGHVLRYTRFYSIIKEYLSIGAIGNVVHINMSENVSYYHYAHSFVRGNWNNRVTSSPMILAKCCHDLDLMYWFTDSLPDMISSFGGLHHFEKSGEDLPERCTDGCSISETCIYYAPRIYEEILPLLHVSLKSDNFVNRVVIKLAIKYPWLKLYKPFSKINEYGQWPVSVITSDTSLRGKRKALENGPYGRCVYKIKDHNVVDHQQVSIIFENGITANLTMQGHSSEEGRTIRIDGTEGTIYGEFMLSHQKLVHIDSLTNKKTVLLDIKRESGHGGGDIILVGQFIEIAGKKKNNEKYNVQTSADKSIVSHLMAFAADKSRIEQSIIDFRDILS